MLRSSSLARLVAVLALVVTAACSPPGPSPLRVGKAAHAPPYRDAANVPATAPTLPPAAPGPVEAAAPRIIRPEPSRARQRRPAVPAPVVSGSAAENRALGQVMAAAAGWTGSEWACLDSLWGAHESGWRTDAANPRSQAFGIPQANPGRKMASAETAEDRAAGRTWRNSAAVQVRWGLGYLAGRYGSPCRALAFRLAHGSY